jgi:hypothetical protein
MVRTLRLLALGLATAAALQLGAVDSARAADTPAASDVGAARVARVLFRRLEPLMLVLLDELLDCLPGTGGAAPPPPPEPLVDDPDYTP